MGRQDRSKRAQESPRAAQDPLKTAPKPPKTLQRKGPRARKSGPRPPQDGPRPLPGARLGRLRSHLGTNRSQDQKTVDFCQICFGFWVDFGSQNGSQNDPKTTPKRIKIQDEKCITFLSLLDPSWTGLGAILGASWGHFLQFRIGFTDVS